MSVPPQELALPTTIDEVIAQLGEVITRSIREGSRLGYFAALYRRVTIQVKAGIAAGRFENGPRMERLDVMFANRYLAALQQFRAGEKPSRCWLDSFEAAASGRLIILQHLLLGMNAHINFDLGIAAAEIAPGSEMPSLQHDFDEINAILAGLVAQVQSEIYAVSPWIRLLGRIDPRADDAVTNFSMKEARGSAWDLATRLAALDPQTWTPDLDARDEETSLLADLVRHPDVLLLRLGLLVISSRESRNVAKVIGVLNGPPTP